MTYYFTLSIEPKGQARPRSCIVGGHAKIYKNMEQAHYEAKIRALLAGDAPVKPLEGPVNVSINCYLPIPASWSIKKHHAANDKKFRPAVKPDIDNIAKQCLDCMNGLIWKDDKQVVGLAIEKYYSNEPRWEITVGEVW